MYNIQSSETAVNTVFDLSNVNNRKSFNTYSKEVVEVMALGYQQSTIIS